MTPSSDTVTTLDLQNESNAMGQISKSSALEDMKILAHSIDARHWECICEKARSGSDKNTPATSPTRSPIVPTTPTILTIPIMPTKINPKVLAPVTATTRTTSPNPPTTLLPTS